MSLNPFVLIIAILKIVEAQVLNQSALVVRQLGISVAKISTRVIEIAADVIDGALTPSEGRALIDAQFETLKTSIDAAIGTGEIAAEQLPTDIMAAIKDTVFGAIGSLF